MQDLIKKYGHEDWDSSSINNKDEFWITFHIIGIELKFTEQKYDFKTTPSTYGVEIQNIYSTQYIASGGDYNDTNSRYLIYIGNDLEQALWHFRDIYKRLKTSRMECAKELKGMKV